MSDDVPRPMEFEDDSEAPYEGEAPALPSGGAVPFAPALTYDELHREPEPASNPDDQTAELPE